MRKLPYQFSKWVRRVRTGLDVVNISAVLRLVVMKAWELVCLSPAVLDTASTRSVSGGSTCIELLQ